MGYYAAHSEFSEGSPQPQPEGPDVRYRRRVPLAALCHMANISYRTGRKLHFDPQAERFVNDAEANSLITREYREPFVVPEKV